MQDIPVKFLGASPVWTGSVRRDFAGTDSLVRPHDLNG